MKTSEKIIKYLKLKKQVSVKELVDYLEISRIAVSKQLRKLLDEGKLVKIGKPPKVFYSLAEKKIPLAKKILLDSKTKRMIEENYLIITPSGERKEGVGGFVYWCEKNNLPVEKTAGEYIRTLKKYNAFKKNGLINGMKKFRNTFKKVFWTMFFIWIFTALKDLAKQNLDSCFCTLSKAKTGNLCGNWLIMFV